MDAGAVPASSSKIIQVRKIRQCPLMYFFVKLITVRSFNVCYRLPMSDRTDDSNLQGISNPPDDYDHLQRLPGEENPMNDPDDVPKELDDTHPATDTNIDPSEEYDEGLSGAAEAEER
jgi:hypothetical protein